MINRWIGGVLMASCIVGSACGAEPTQGVPAAEVAQIKADVTAAANEYLAKFSRGDAKGIAESVYSHPAITIRNGTVELTDEAAIADRYTNNIKTLKTTGWVKSAFIDPKVCVLSRTVALMSSRFARYDKDNKVIVENGETDLFTKTPQGWKLVALFGHDAAGGINCKE